MMNKKTSKQSIYLLLVMSLPILLIVLFSIKNRSNQDIPENVRDAENILLSWEKLSFTSLSDKSKLLSYLKSLPISGEDLLSPIQKDTLFSSIVTMCDAYSQGTYDAYKKFRIPEGIPYELNEIEWEKIAMDWYQSHPKATPSEIPNDFELFQWNVLTQSKGTCYKDYWKKICLDSRDIYKKLGTKSLLDQEAHAGIYVTRDFLWNMNNGAGNFYNMFTANGILTVGPFFRFYPNGMEDLDSFASEKVLSVSLYFFVKPSQPDPVISLAVQWVWDEQTTQWIPMSMVRGDWMAMENPEFSKPGRSFVF